MISNLRFLPFFFFNDTATTEIYTLSLHDALPISAVTGLVSEAMRKIVSRCIGSPPPAAFMPMASTCNSSRRPTRATRPGTPPRSTWPAMISCMRPSRAFDNPPLLIACSRGPLIRYRRSTFLRHLPQAHHASLGIGEEGERAHAGHLLLLDVDLAARRDDLLAIGREVVDVDVEEHVAGPRPFPLRLQDAAIDAARAAGFDDAIVQFGNVPDLPVENLRVEVRYLGRILRHQFPVNDRSAHDDLLSKV